MKKISECTEIEVNSSFSREEEGITFILHSSEKVNCEIINIDKCVLLGDGIKSCDWLFAIIKNDENTEKKKYITGHYVELKGNDMRRACEQLFNGIDRTKSNFANCDFEAHVISTKGYQPEIKNREHYKKVKRLIRKEIHFHKVHKGNNYTHIEKL